MIEKRTPAEVAGGYLQCRIAGVARNMPTLKIRAERDWKLLLIKSIGESKIEIDFDALQKGGEDTYNAAAPLANLAGDIMLDLVLEYDKSGALGGRDFLEENADSSDIYVILMRCLQVVFPFVNDLRGAVLEIRSWVPALMELGRSEPSSSTNGHSEAGELTLNDSKVVSIASNSKNSGASRKSESSESSASN